MSQTTINSATLIRGDVWSNDIKEIVQDELMGMGYVNWIDFPDGTTWHIPSVGEATVRDYVEDNAVKYDALDVGEFTFTVTQYKSSGLYITKKMRQDSFYAARLEASFVPKQTRAFMEVLESDIFALAAAGASGGQTGANPNLINTAPHRFVARGTNQAVGPSDFALVLHSLKKANMGSRIIGIVDPSVEYQLNTLTNLVNVSNNPRWEGVIAEGLVNDMKFVKNVYGIDLYVSNYLPAAGTAASGNESIDIGPGAVAIANGAGICNVFFSVADASNMPFVGAWRQQVEVESEYNKDYQREEYLLTARYGLKVYRPENLVVLINDSSQLV